MSAEKELIEKVVIKIGYNSLPSGVDEHDLVMYVWNDNLGRWEIEENTGVDTLHNYVWALKDSLSGDVNVPTDDEDADGLNNEQETFEDDYGNSLVYWFEAEDYNATGTEAIKDAPANDPDGDGYSAVLRRSSGDVINVSFTPPSGYYKYYVKARTNLIGNFVLRLLVTEAGVVMDTVTPSTLLPDVNVRVVNFYEYKWYSTSSFEVTGSITLHAQVNNNQWGGIIIDKVGLVKFKDAEVTTTDDPDGIVSVSGSQTAQVNVRIPVFNQSLTGYVANATMEISSITLFANQSVFTDFVDVGQSIRGRGTQWIAQRFLSPLHDVKLSHLELYVYQLPLLGTPIFGNLEVEIQTESANKPSGSTISGGKAFWPSIFPLSSPRWINVSFSSQPVLSGNTSYWIVLKSPASINASYRLGVSVDQYKGSSYHVAVSNDNGSSWYRIGPGAGKDLMFKLHAAAPKYPYVSMFIGMFVFKAWSYSGGFKGNQTFDFSGPLNNYLLFLKRYSLISGRTDASGNVLVPIYFGASSLGILTFSKFCVELEPTVSDISDPDTDADGLKDGAEWTGVFDRDSDNDLMSDGYEIEGGGRNLQDPLKFNERFALHLVVSFNWDVGSTYLNRYITAMRMASNYLLDATDGYMLIGSVTFYDNKAYWNKADIRVGKGDASTGMNTDPFWPQAYVGGIRIKPKVQSGEYRGILMPQTFLGHYPNETFLDFYRPYFTALTHEILHYAIFAYDEYLNKDEKQHPNPPHTIMNQEWNYSELSTRLDYIYTQWNAINSTYQFFKRRQSCWETFYRYWNSYEGEFMQAIRFDFDKDGVADRPVDSDNNGIVDVLENYVPDDGPVEDVGSMIDFYSYT